MLPGYQLFEYIEELVVLLQYWVVHCSLVEGLDCYTDKLWDLEVELW